MNSLIFLKLTISFIIGGLWVVLATTLADKFGPKVGGLVAGLPFTVMFGLFFIGWTQSSSVAVSATTIIPIIGGINCVFLLSYVYLVKKRLWLSLLASFFIWFALSFLLVVVKFDNYLFSVVGYFILLGVSYYFMEHKLKIKSVVGKKIKYNSTTLVLRALLSGTVVVFIVFIGKVGGPIFGGLFAAFPAMFTSTLLITYFSHGPDFSSAIVKGSMIGGVSITLYSMVVRYTYVPLGIGLGTIISILISFGSGYLIYNSILEKLN